MQENEGQAKNVNKVSDELLSNLREFQLAQTRKDVERMEEMKDRICENLDSRIGEIREEKV